MKIVKIVGYGLSSPYGNGNVLGQPLGVKSVGLVEVHTDAGLVGLGETYAGVYAPELIAPIAELIGSRLKGLDPLSPERVAQAADIPFISRNGLFCSVYSAVDIALWDIASQAAGKPLHALLGGGERPPLRTYASGGSAALDPEAVAADASSARESGYGAFKMRVGFQTWDNDLLRVGAAREALGEDAGLMVDAIMGTLRPPWDRDLATKRIKDLARFRPTWIEEPLHPDDVTGMSELRPVSAVPVAAGEALTGILDYSAYLKLGAVDFIQVDATHCGGITMGMRIIEMANKLGVPVAMHVWGSAAAYAANAHLAFSHRNVAWLEVPMVSFALSAQMGPALTPAVNDGFAHRPDAIGLGVALNDELKRRYRLVEGSGYRL